MGQTGTVPIRPNWVNEGQPPFDPESIFRDI